jgi:hypothetical protein
MAPRLVRLRVYLPRLAPKCGANLGHPRILRRFIGSGSGGNLVNTGRCRWLTVGKLQWRKRLAGLEVAPTGMGSLATLGMTRLAAASLASKVKSL